jgi:ribosomal protein S18 acetylase RimI-like enzyme
MITFSNPHIDIAGLRDIPSLTALLNIAYRGEHSKKGWTTEAFLIAGDKRTDENDLQQVMLQPGSVILKYNNEQQQISGCVNLQQHGNKIYLGMFCVSPQAQGKGIGKQILQATEEYARHLQCIAIYMSVISARTELINWYQRRGYQDTGERTPFKEEELTGKPVLPLVFMVM